MAQLTLQPRQRNRLRPVAERVAVAEVVEPEVSVAPVIDELPVLIPVLEYLTRKNPALGKLIQTFDLVEVGPTYNMAANGFPAGVDVVEALRRLQLAGPGAVQPLPDPTATASTREPLPGLVDKLRSIAARALAEGDAYDYETAIERIATATNVSPERARNGFDLLLTHQLIAPTPGDTYYRTDTTPF